MGGQRKTSESMLELVVHLDKLIFLKESRDM